MYTFPSLPPSPKLVGTILLLTLHITFHNPGETSCQDYSWDNLANWTLCLEGLCSGMVTEYLQPQVVPHSIANVPTWNLACQGVTRRVWQTKDYHWTALLPAPGSNWLETVFPYQAVSDDTAVGCPVTAAPKYKYNKCKCNNCNNP